MTPSQLTRALKGLIDTRRPVFVWGPPGVGKSQIVARVAADLKRDVIDLRAALMDPTDLKGLPAISTGKARRKFAEWCPPNDLPWKGTTSGPGIIFADELAQAAPLVQSAFLQGVLDHRIGAHELCPDWVWIAASNRQEDRAGAHRIISPLLNRFIHLDLEVCNEEWQAWAVEAGICVEVRSFLKYKSTLLHAFEPTSGERSFPTPRSWQFLSDALKATPEDLLFPVAQGCVGKGAATEFVAYLRTYRNLPRVDDILRDPKGHFIPTEPDKLWAITGTLIEKARQCEQTVLQACVCYIARLPLEFAGWAIRDIVKARPRVIELSECSAWIVKHRSLICDVA